MRQAADTASRISSHGDKVGPVDVRAEPALQYYPVLSPSVDAPAAEKLELIRQQVKDGSLVIRKMTDAERKANPVRPPKPKKPYRR